MKSGSGTKIATDATMDLHSQGGTKIGSMAGIDMKATGPISKDAPMINLNGGLAQLAQVAQIPDFAQAVKSTTPNVPQVASFIQESTKLA